MAGHILALYRARGDAMTKLRRPTGLLERRRAKEAEIASLIKSDPRFAAVAAKVWADITAADGIEGVLMVDGKPVTPSDRRGVTKALK